MELQADPVRLNEGRQLVYRRPGGAGHRCDIHIVPVIGWSYEVRFLKLLDAVGGVDVENGVEYI
jgi:hypothetical protein